MEWVETTAKSVEEAKELALDQLGVAADDAEFDILEEPRPGLFGRVRGEARVRARARPTADRRDRRRRERDQKPDSSSGRDQKPDSSSGRPARPARKEGGTAVNEPATADTGASDAGSGDTRRPTPADVAVEAEKFVGGLLGALELEGSCVVHRDAEELEVVIEGENLGLLIGPRGTTLLAVQDLVRVASQRRIGDHDTRLRVDVNGYREKRREALSRFALTQADAVVSSGEARELEPMPSADRKVIHDALVERTDVTTKSEGDDPYRRVVILPAP